MNFAAAFETALPYEPFLAKYGSPDQKQRWENFLNSVSLTDLQNGLISSFVRKMNVLVLAGTWCGDCVNQCPIFFRFAQASPLIDVRFLDRDDNPEVAAALHTCGGARVPALVFLSEDGHVCGRAGDRTLSKYRSIVSGLGGAHCPTGLVIEHDLTKSVVQDWLDEFERIQWMLRTSSRLRQLHGD